MSTTPLLSDDMHATLAQRIDTARRTGQGIDIALISQRSQVLATEHFTGLGITLTDKQLIVVKSAQHFHARFAPLATALPHVRQNRLRALAVTSTKRVGLLPELPTVAELGYRGYQSGNWYGILLPARSPREIIASLHGQTVKALAAPALNKRLVDLGYISIGDTPEEFAQFTRSEIAKWAQVVKSSGAKVE